MDNQNTAPGNPFDNQPISGAGNPPLPPLPPTPMAPPPPPIDTAPPIAPVAPPAPPQVNISSSAPIENFNVEVPPAVTEPVGAPTFSPIGGIPTPPIDNTEQKDDTDGGGDEPELKPKRRLAPAIMAVLALFLVAAVAGASYYISTQLSSRVAVAPTAPESEPMATSTFPLCGSGLNCSSNAINGASKCTSPTYGNIYYCCPSGETIEGDSCSGFDEGGGECSNPTNCGSPYCVGDTCVKSCAEGSSGTACFIGADGCDGCGGGDDTCPAGQKYEDDTWGWHTEVSCGQGCPAGQGKKIRCNWSSPDGYSCVISGSNDYLNACKDAAGNQHWEYGACEVSASCATCDSTLRDAPASTSVTFSKAGPVLVFTRNISGNITLAGPTSNQVVTATAGNAVKQSQFFNVQANTTYTMSVKLASEANYSYGWIKNKAVNTCGPTKSALCGQDVDISAVNTLAVTNADLTGITAGGTPANIQCWGDMVQNDASQDYDFNDFTIVFGYPKPATCRQACSGTKPCASGLTCSGGVCRNSSCSTTDDSSCNCSVTPATCRQKCSSTQPCASGLTCTGGMCRNSSCPTTDSDFTCECPVVPATCREGCSSTKPCASGLTCSGGVCRNSSCPTTDNEFTCECPGDPPATPNLTAAPQCTSANVSTVNLSWITVTGANNYYLYRCAGSGCVATTQLGSALASTATSFTDSTVVAGTVYNYRIRAYRTSDTTYSNYSATQQVIASNCTIAPACVAVQVAALKNGVWTKLTASEISTNVKVGDTIRLYGEGNASSSRMRFKATDPSGQAAFTPEWKEAVREVNDADKANMFYVELSISISGSYSFEAQVL